MFYKSPSKILLFPIRNPEERELDPMHLFIYTYVIFPHKNKLRADTCVREREREREMRFDDDDDQKKAALLPKPTTLGVTTTALSSRMRRRNETTSSNHRLLLCGLLLLLPIKCCLLFATTTALPRPVLGFGEQQWRTQKRHHHRSNDDDDDFALMHDGWWSSGEEDVARFVGFHSPEKLFGAQSFFAKLQHKLEAPKLRGMASFVPRKMEGKKETEEEEPKESFGFMRDAFIGGQFVSGASPDLDVGVAVRVPRAAFAEKHELEKMAENVEWFVFGDENPGEKVEHESETSVVFARIRRPKRGQFELPMKFRARYAKPVFQSGEEAKREVKEAKKNESESDANTDREADTGEKGEEKEEKDETKWGKTHSRIVFPNVVILARREQDTGAWTRVGELEMKGSWYVPIAYSNHAAGVKMVSILITLGAGAFVFKAMRQKITEEEKYGGSKRSAAIPSLKKRTSKKRN